MTAAYRRTHNPVSFPLIQGSAAAWDCSTFIRQTWWWLHHDDSTI